MAVKTFFKERTRTRVRVGSLEVLRLAFVLGGRLSVRAHVYDIKYGTDIYTPSATPLSLDSTPRPNSLRGSEGQHHRGDFVRLVRDVLRLWITWGRQWLAPESLA